MTRTTGPGRGEAAPTPSHRFRAPRGALRDAAPALVGYVLVRLAGLLLAFWYGSTHDKQTLVRLGTFWDAGWYVRIVQTGYSVGDGFIGMHNIPYSPRAFFPLFPWLADAVRWVLPVSPGTALALVSSAASLAAAWGIHAVGRFCYGRRVGVIAAVLWGVLPLAVLENTAYSEALFTALAAWTLYAVLTRRWLTAGVLCLLAGLSRPSAMALTAAVGLAALLELVACLRGRGSGHWLRPLVAGLLSPLGWAGYMLWTGWVLGSWGAYFHIQQAWASSFDGGGTSLHWFEDLLFGSRAVSGIPLSDAVMALTLACYLVLFALTLVHRQPLPLLVFSAALLVIDLGNASPAPPFARFLLPAFPLLLPLAVSLGRLRSRGSLAVVLGSATLLSGLYGVFVLFIGGAPG
ncbi:glycosyltransferase family 39 protein [Streptacidiphilus sp. PAMC 29251]